MLARIVGSPYSDAFILCAGLVYSGMNRFRAICRTSLLLVSGLALVITLVLGVISGVLTDLTAELDSLIILLMIYASYPLFIMLLLWPGKRNRFECWPLVTGGLLILGVAVYSWSLVVAAGPGAMPALAMALYGMVQILVVTILFILLALIRVFHSRKMAVTG